MLLVFLASVGNVDARSDFPKLDIYTEIWEPFQFEGESGEITGFAVELLDLMLKDVNSTQSRKDFKIVPWARLIMNLKRQDTLGFSMLKTPERDELYQWVGPFFTINNYVIVKINSRLDKSSFSSGNNITAASIIGDASFNYLINLGINKKNIFEVSHAESTILMLEKERVDIVIDNWNNFKGLAIKSGVSLKNYKRLIDLGGGDGYFVVSNGADPEIVRKLQLSLEKHKSSKQYYDLLMKYELDI